MRSMTIVSVGDLIDALGGTGAVAGTLGVQDNTVSTWRWRGLPGWARMPLDDAARKMGLTVDPSVFGARPRTRSAA